MAAAADESLDDVVMTAVVDPLVTLGCTGVFIQMPLSLAKASGLVREAVDRSGEYDGTKFEYIISTNIPKDVCEKAMMRIHEYLVECKGSDMPQDVIPRPLPDMSVIEHRSKWVHAFFKELTVDDAIMMVQIANYLDLKGLMNISAARIASFVKGVPVDKIKDVLLPSWKKPASA